VGGASADFEQVADLHSLLQGLEDALGVLGAVADRGPV
jgi:hypothetical protein